MENPIQKSRQFFAPSNSSKIFIIITLLILFAAIPLTVFIAQQQQEIRQRAQEVAPTPSPTIEPTATPSASTLTPSPTPLPTETPTPIQSEPTIVLGNANGDATVDIMDFNIWRDEFLGTSQTKQADFNKDGRVDLLDFSIWRNAIRS